MKKTKRKNKDRKRVRELLLNLKRHPDKINSWMILKESGIGLIQLKYLLSQILLNKYHIPSISVFNG